MEQALILLANLFQGVYFFSVLLMWAACFDKVKTKGLTNLSLKEQGVFWSATVACWTFCIAQVVEIFGLHESIPTAPVSVFIWSVFFNLEEYAGISLFQLFKK